MTARQTAGMSGSMVTGGPVRAATRFTWGSITVEHVLYATLLALGLSVRFWGIARMPLTALEAVNSWAAWRAAMDVTGPEGGIPTSALFLQLQTLLFWLGANGDAAARAVSAAAGTLLVAVPWLMRGLLGRTPALVLAAFIALDPWLVAFSRLADGAMLSTALALLLLALLAALALSESDVRQPVTLRLSAQQRKVYTMLAAGAAGLFLASGQLVWGYLPVLAAFVALNYAALRRAVRLDAPSIALFAGALVLGSSGWLAQPGGISLIGASLTEALDSGLSEPLGTLGNNRFPFAWVWRTLLADQPLVTLFGIVGLVHMLWRRRLATYEATHWPIFLWFWLAWALAVSLLPGRGPFVLPVLVFPLLFGSAYVAGRLIEATPAGSERRETLGVVAIVLLLLISASLWAASLVASQALDLLVAQAVLLLLLLSVVTLIFLGIWIGRKQALWAAAVAFGVALLASNIGASWGVNHRYDSGRTSGLFSGAGDPNVRLLVHDIETLSAHRTGDPHQIPVIVEKTAIADSRPVASGTDLPAQRVSDSLAMLRWYLRDMPRLQWGGGPGADLTMMAGPLVISDSGADAIPQLLAGSDYVGAEYQIYTELQYGPLRAEMLESSGPQTLRSAVNRLWSEYLQPWLRWAIYRSGQPAGSGESATDSVTLWAPRSE